MMNPKDFDNCAHVTRGGKPCTKKRWLHDMGRARHKFVEADGPSQYQLLRRQLWEPIRPSADKQQTGG